MMTAEHFMSVRDAAKALQISEGTIRDWIARRKIATYKPLIGRGMYVDLTEIEAKRTLRKRPAEGEDDDGSHES